MANLPRHPHNAVKVVIKTLKRDILVTACPPT
jgi:hypothetical protein